MRPLPEMWSWKNIHTKVTNPGKLRWAEPSSKLDELLKCFKLQIIDVKRLCSSEQEQFVMKKRKMCGEPDRWAEDCFRSPGLFGQSCVAWWVPVLQWRLGQAILEQAGAKGEKAKGPSTTQTPVPPQWATLGPCGLASGAGRQLAGALSHLLLVLFHFLFLICFSLSHWLLFLYMFVALPFLVSSFSLKQPEFWYFQVSVHRQTELKKMETFGD